MLTRRVREKITHFTFKYTDVSYDAKNDAKQVTNHGVILLSKSLPNLKVLELPGTTLITDEAVIALIQNCPQMKSIEVAGSRYGGLVEGKALDELREHPEFVPGLKSLILENNEGSKVFMKALREMSKARPALEISLVSRTQTKSYGDWCLEENATHYKNGRKSLKKPSGKRFKSVY